MKRNQGYERKFANPTVTGPNHPGMINGVIGLEASVWIPLASGALGIAGALAGTAITQRATRRREDRRWNRDRELDLIRHERERAERQRERRMELYVDLAEYVQNERSTLDASTDEYAGRRDQLQDLKHPDRLTARVNLYAPVQVREPWAALVRAGELVRWEWTEGDVNHSSHNSWFDEDNPAVMKMDQAIKEMHAALAKVIDVDG